VFDVIEGAYIVVSINLDVLWVDFSLFNNLSYISDVCYWFL